MKQGTASHSGMGATKVEPRSQAISPKLPAREGMQVIPTRPTAMYEGRGIEAPMAGKSIHHSGSQGKH